MTLLFAALAAMAAALALHPFVTYPLSLRLLARAAPRPVRAGIAPARLAVCVCAYNEEQVIAARVDNLLSFRGEFPDLEVLVYVDAAADRTADILHGYSDRIRVVVATERHGKTYGMNTLLGMTDAEVVVFSDANVIFDPKALRRLVEPFGDPEVGCVCGNLRYQAGGTATAATGSLYWRLEEHIKALESATGSVMGADGSIFAIRRALHVPPPADLIDDMFVSLSILCGGARIVRAADAIAYEESVSRPGEEYRRKIRIACQAFNVHRALQGSLAGLGALDRYKYLSHKLLRWLAIYFLAASWLLATAAAASLGALPALSFAAVTLAGAGLIALSSRGPLGKLRDVLAALLATGIGVARSVRGDRFQTWTPPTSARRTITLASAPAGH